MAITGGTTRARAAPTVVGTRRARYWGSGFLGLGVSEMCSYIMRNKDAHTPFMIPLYPCQKPEP